MNSSRSGALALMLSVAAFLHDESFAQTPSTSAPPAAAAPTPTGIPSPESQIRRILNKQEIAWNVGDSASWGNTFCEDADFINILGQVFHGREAITQVHATLFNGEFKGSHTKVTIHQFRQITPDVVLIEALHEVTGYRFLPSGITPTEASVLKTRVKYVLIKRDEVWQIVAAQNTAILPVAAPTVH